MTHRRRLEEDEAVDNEGPQAEPLRDQNLAARLEAYLAEYNALRAEIEWLIRDGNQYQALALTFGALIVSALGYVTQQAPELLPAGLLIVPFPLCLLGFLFFRQHEEVYVVAAYLSESVRPRVRNLVGDQELWQWEEFKTHRLDLLRSGPLRMLPAARIVLLFRALLFVMPSILATVVAATLLVLPGQMHYSGDPLLRALLLFALVFDVLITSFLVFYLWTQGDLARRVFASVSAATAARSSVPEKVGNRSENPTDGDA
jgi:hypothetical protein